MSLFLKSTGEKVVPISKQFGSEDLIVQTLSGEQKTVQVNDLDATGGFREVRSETAKVRSKP